MNNFEEHKNNAIEYNLNSNASGYIKTFSINELECHNSITPKSFKNNKKNKKNEKIRKIKKLKYKKEIIIYGVPRPSWDERYEQLKQFKKKYGHCNVPYRWCEHPGLGRWVSLMRRKKREKQLEADKETMLNQLSFSWSLVGYRVRLDKYQFNEHIIDEDLKLPFKKRKRMLNAFLSENPEKKAIINLNHNKEKNEESGTILQ